MCIIKFDEQAGVYEVYLRDGTWLAAFHNLEDAQKFVREYC